MKDKLPNLRYTQFVDGLIDIFEKNTKCNIQYKSCPCNTCFHAQKGDFKHICWLILLALRGDYNHDRRNILRLIHDELQEVDDETRLH